MQVRADGNLRTGGLKPASPPTSPNIPTIDPQQTSSLRTEVGEFGYLESGPSDGFPVLLLHGVPDDALA